MAGIKITDLPILSSPVTDDLLYVVDVSDTSSSPQGTSKQVTIENVIALVPPPSVGVQSVTGEWVDNTDPINPVINRPYLSWVGKISQTGTSDPTIVAEFENTITNGVVTFSRTSSGYFGIDTISGGLSTGVFVENKTLVLATAGGSTYNDCFVVISSISGGKINFYNYGNGGGYQDEFTNMNIEIRVYS